MKKRSQAALGALFLVTCGVAISDAAVFTVTSVADSGPGTLRQAILDNNAHAATSGSNRIEFAFTGTAPWVIKIQGTFLPPLKGPVVVGMKSDQAAAPVAAAVGGRGASGGRGGGRGAAVPVVRSVAELAPPIVLDGSGLVNCPGAGLAVEDSHDVEISGIEIRDFCAGIATVRSNNVYIHDMKIVGNQGAAGVTFTDLSFNNRLVNSLLLDNRAGFGFARGTHDSLLQGNYIALTQPVTEKRSAVNFATSGDNNALIGNTFTRFTDVAVTVGANHQTIRDNKFISNINGGLRASGSDLLIEGNTFTDNGGTAMTVGGARARVLDNVITGSGGSGVVAENATVTLSRNSIFNNAHLGISLVAAGAHPMLSNTSKWSADGIILNGTLTGKPNQRYSVELFASRAEDRHTGDEHGWGEGERYLGTAYASADAAGKASFTLPLDLTDPFGNGQTTGFFTATATDSAGSTSIFSRALPLRFR